MAAVIKKRLPKKNDVTTAKRKMKKSKNVNNIKIHKGCSKSNGNVKKEGGKKTKTVLLKKSLQSKNVKPQNMKRKRANPDPEMSKVTPAKDQKSKIGRKKPKLEKEISSSSETSKSKVKKKVTRVGSKISKQNSANGLKPKTNKKLHKSNSKNLNGTLSKTEDLTKQGDNAGKAENVTEKAECKKRKRKIRRAKRIKDRPINLGTIKDDALQQAIKGLKKVVEDGGSKPNSKVLFGSDDIGMDTMIFLQVTIVKIPYLRKRQIVEKSKAHSIRLPHSLVTENSEVILLVKDRNRGIRKDHRRSLNRCTKHLKKHKAADLITQIMPLRQLKTEHCEYEAKRKLASRVDVLLCDGAIMRLVPKILGKHFYSRKKVPLQVDFRAKDFRSEILKVLSKTPVIIPQTGNSLSVKVSLISHTDQQVFENVMAAVKGLNQLIPGGWENILSLSLKAPRATSVPFYVKPLRSIQSVPLMYPPPPPMKEKPEVGVITTQPDLKVEIYPDGTVKARKITKGMHAKIDKEDTERMEKEIAEQKEDEKVQREEREPPINCARREKTGKAANYKRKNFAAIQRKSMKTEKKNNRFNQQIERRKAMETEKKVTVTKAQKNEKKGKVIKVQKNEKKKKVTKVQKNEKKKKVTKVQKNEKKEKVTKVQKNEKKEKVTKVQKKKNLKRLNNDPWLLAVKRDKNLGKRDQGIAVEEEEEDAWLLRD